MIVTNELISMNQVEDRLTAQDDPGVWKEILAVLGEEFLQRYRAEQCEKESWFLRIGACSHWVRPHQIRWLAAGGLRCPSDTREDSNSARRRRYSNGCRACRNTEDSRLGTR